MGEILIDILIIAACILLILVVLIQDSKGGGLTSSFGSSNQILGVRRTTDFLEKATWTFAILVIALSLASGFVGGSSSSGPASNSVSKQAADQANIPNQTQGNQNQPNQPANTTTNQPTTPPAKTN